MSATEVSEHSLASFPPCTIDRVSRRDICRATRLLAFMGCDCGRTEGAPTEDRFPAHGRNPATFGKLQHHVPKELKHLRDGHSLIQ
jgi:hypothetical protein